MKQVALLLLLCAATLSAQNIWQVPLWEGRRGNWYVLGPSFVVRGNVIDIVPITIASAHEHITGVVLTDSNGAYSIPATATHLALYRNGMRQTSGVDYELKGGTITTLFAWGAGNLVVADYQMPAQ